MGSTYEDIISSLALRLESLSLDKPAPSRAKSVVPSVSCIEDDDSSVSDDAMDVDFPSLPGGAPLALPAAALVAHSNVTVHPSTRLASDLGATSSTTQASLRPPRRCAFLRLLIAIVQSLLLDVALAVSSKLFLGRSLKPLMFLRLALCLRRKRKPLPGPMKRPNAASTVPSSADVRLLARGGAWAGALVQLLKIVALVWGVSDWRISRGWALRTGQRTYFLGRAMALGMVEGLFAYLRVFTDAALLYISTAMHVGVHIARPLPLWRVEVFVVAVCVWRAFVERRRARLMW